MNIITYLQGVFRHVAWANRRTVEAVRAAPEAQTETLPLLAHLLASEHIWLARLQQQAARHTVWPSLAIDACAALATENEAGYSAYLNQVDDVALESLVHYRTSQGLALATPALDILTHVLTHGPYHRGQIAKAIGHSGGTPATTDFIIWLRESNQAK